MIPAIPQLCSSLIIALIARTMVTPAAMTREIRDRLTRLSIGGFDGSNPADIVDGGSGAGAICPTTLMKIELSDGSTTSNFRRSSLLSSFESNSPLDNKLD